VLSSRKYPEDAQGYGGDRNGRSYESLIFFAQWWRVNGRFAEWQAIAGTTDGLVDKPALRVLPES
jgi:hypothetical protein